MINALRRITYVPLAYNHASLHMSTILMTLMRLMSHNMQHMLGTRLPPQFFCIAYRRCITAQLFCIVYRRCITAQIFCIVYRRCMNCTQSASSKQHRVYLYTSFVLQAEGQDVAGCEQHRRPISYNVTDANN
jgi:hypothetical protein